MTATPKPNILSLTLCGCVLTGTVVLATADTPAGEGKPNIVYIKDIEFCVGTSPDTFGDPVAKATLDKTREASRIPCSKPVQGRYVLLRSRSEITGGPWATAAEVGVAGH